MSADLAAVLLVLSAAPAATIAALLYPLSAPWWRSLTGLALFASLTGLALLIDISLAYQWLGDDYALRDVVRITVYAWISLGCNLTLAAIIVERLRRSRDRRRAAGALGEAE